MNKNLAGSYAPSSLREVMRRVVEIDDNGHFALRPKHWELALEHLLLGRRISAVILAGYFFRNYAFITAGSIEPPELVDVFRVVFGYHVPKDDQEFSALYTREVPSSTAEWFEPWQMSS